MTHRGPDGDGIYIDGALGLAHRRLAIIDLEGGVQPMSTEDGSLWISYNGEVFNYVELFDELRARGHKPVTRSDTEAVLLAYREWGLDFASHFNGMFAIAIWDAPRRRLVLCRDRMGVKPLYYAETASGIVFASELKALRSAEGVDTSLDLDSLDEYMTLGYVVNPRSLVRGVRKLEPGTLLTADLEQGVRFTRYWSLKFEPDHRPTEREWTAQVRALFDDSVRLRLRSDVPLGVLLSGGVDSNAIATTVANREGNIDTFCVGVDVEGVTNEFDRARAVAERIGSRHHELRLTEAQNGALLLEAAALLDEPLVEPMVAQLFGVCRLARKQCTVLLSGEGADETWFGYTAYRFMYGIELAQKLVPNLALRALVPMLERATQLVPTSPLLAKYMRLAAEPLERRYLGLSFFDTTMKDRVYSPALRSQLSERDARETLRRLYDDAGGPEAMSRMAAVDCRGWLVDNTLLRSDLMSMAASVELRVPFLDYRLVELAARVPARFKVKLNDQKVILKEAVSDRLPRKEMARRKVGFTTPLAMLFRGHWGHEAEAILTTPTAATAGLFDRALLKRLMAEHRSGQHNWSRILFQILMLEYWGRAADATPPFRPDSMAS